jgi:hypothetical protein
MAGWPIRVLWAAIAVLLLAGTAGVVVVDDGDDEGVVAGGPTTTISPTSTIPPAQSRLDDEVPGLQAFVEQHRGLKFKRPVKVTLLDDKAFRDRLLADVEEENDEEVSRAQGLFRALRLIKPGVDLLAEAKEQLGEGVVGFFDPTTDDLVVRGAEPNAYVRQILVHELTHALQHQHFDLDRPELDEVTDSEVGLGFTAVVEGDATRIDEAYLDSLPQDQRIEAIRAEKEVAEGSEGSDESEAIGMMFAFPYIFGPDFVKAVLKAGGQQRLDRLFASPPTTAEQVMHPERFLAGEGVRPVQVPRADRPPFEDGVFGELGFGIILSQLMSQERAFAAADGWGGDRYVAWKEDNRVCVRVSVASDDYDERAELADALDRWVRQHGAAVFEVLPGTATTTERFGAVLTIKACE